MTVPQESNAHSDPKRIPHRSRKGPIVFVVLTLLLIGWSLVWFWQQAHARYRVISNIDPDTGYHAVYTVSQGWQRSTPKITYAAAKKGGMVVRVDQYSLPVPSALQTWIDRYLLHKNMPTTIMQPALENTIQMDVVQADSKDLFCAEDSQGYLTPKSWLPQAHILKQERLQISGNPATWFLVRVQLSPSRQYSFAELLVKPLHQSIVFRLAGRTESEAHFQEIVRETTAIRDSLRIER